MNTLQELKMRVIDDIKDELKRADMSQTDLAKKLEVSRQMVSVWLKGDAVSLDKLLDIAAVFDLSYTIYLKRN